MSSGRIIVDLKRERSGQFTISSTRAVDVQIPQRSSPSSSMNNLCKRRKLEGSSNSYSNCSFPSGKRLLNYYSNFKKSEILQRLMYYHNGEWNDFPQDVVTYVNKDLKKAAVEVEFNGNNILLDFLHMMQLDMNTGLHQPIPWIDVSGKCFFPEIVSDYDESHWGAERQGSDDINLLLEIKMHETGGESNPIPENAQAHENAAVEEVDDGIKNSAKALEVDANKCEGNQQMEMVTSADPENVPLVPDAMLERSWKR